MKSGLRVANWGLARIAARCALILFGVAATGMAGAQWKVIDDELIRETKNSWKKDGELQNKQIDWLEDLHEQQKIGTHEAAGSIAKDPSEVLDANKPMGALVTDIGVAERCPATKAAEKPGAARTQWQICRLLVQTELAQYKYSLKMYELAKTRHSRLEKIQKEREVLSADDQGKLQDNNNKLLALLALMEIDRQQQKTYMDAYDARIRYLSAARDNVSSKVLHGDPLKELASGGAGLITLKLALEALETEKKDWRSERE